MSHERVERVKEGLAAYNAGDFERVLDLLTDDVELQRVSGLGTLRGKEAVHQLFVPDAFEYQRSEPVLVREHGDAIFAACDWLAKGKGSGAEVRTRAYLVFFFEGQLARRLEFHLDERDALAAAGLTAASGP